jgi:hypothetical protein
MMKVPTSEEAQCLNGWPEGTVGHKMEEEAINQLLDMCKVNGFGRISQLASQLEDIWGNPEKIEVYRKSYAQRTADMLSAAKMNHLQELARQLHITEEHLQDCIMNGTLNALILAGDTLRYKLAHGKPITNGDIESWSSNRRRIRSGKLT